MKKLGACRAITYDEGAGMFGFFRKPGRYHAEAQAEANLAQKLQTNPQILAQLREHGVEVDRALRLEVFFYTNTLEKAEALASELRQTEYDVNARVSAHSKKEFVVTGWSTPVLMTEEALAEWTRGMCDAGLKHDCEFDGWGTNPAQ